MSITHDRVKTATPDVEEDPNRIPEGNAGAAPVPPAPEVVSSTSAAVPLQRTKTPHWLADTTRVVAASVRRVFRTPTRDPRPARKHYPPQYGYLERARVAREMNRP
jgi:hypothetical protein